jgi:hypothetical protein
MNNLLNNILALSPDFLLFLAIGFLLLAVFWYQTGRFFLIGWIVKLIWLAIITPLAFALWLVVSIINSIFDTIRGITFLVWFLRLGLIFATWQAGTNPEYSGFFPFLLMVLFLFFYLTKYGLPEQKMASWIKYSPKAKQTPIKKPKSKPLKIEPTAEELPRPEVKPLLKKQGNFETEAEIINRLDAHLKNLISGG